MTSKTHEAPGLAGDSPDLMQRGSMSRCAPLNLKPQSSRELVLTSQMRGARMHVCAHGPLIGIADLIAQRHFRLEVCARAPIANRHTVEGRPRLHPRHHDRIVETLRRLY